MWPAGPPVGGYALLPAHPQLWVKDLTSLNIRHGFVTAQLKNGLIVSKDRDTADKIAGRLPFVH